MTRALAAVALVLLASTPLVAQAPAGAEGSGVVAALAPADGSGEVTTPVGRVQIVVRVQQASEDFLPAALADAEVRLHLVRQPHEMLETITRTTDAAGQAYFDVQVRPGVEAVAEVDVGRRQFSEAIPLDEPGRHEVGLQAWPVTNDPSVVFVSRLITVLQPAEGYVVVQQVYSLATDRPVIWEPDMSQAGPGMAGRLVRIALPDGAAGVRVVRPAEQVRHLGDNLFFGAEVAPAGEGDDGPSLIVQYSVKTDNASRFVFEQPVSIDTSNVSFVVPRSSTFSRHPVLDVSLDVPICGEGAPAGVVCFETITTDTSGMGIDPNAQVRVARGGRADAGAVLRADTNGWPSRPPWHAVAGLVSALLGLAVGVAFIVRERRAAPADDPLARRVSALEAQRRRLLDEAAAVERAYVDGEILSRDREHRLAAIEAQLAVVHRALRTLRGGADEAPAAEAAASP
jgi:hypothetical protein